MLPSQFVSKLLIGVGATAAFFTLRETCLGYGGKVVSFHHFNLSQDADLAYEKALDYAHNNGIELITSRDDMVAEMREIKRMNAAQIAERAERMAKLEQDHAEALQRAHDEKISMINAGLYPFGQYYNKPFADANVSYLQWVIRTDFSEANDVMQLLSQKVTEQCSHLLPDLDKTVGTIGKRETFHVTITRCLAMFSELYRTWTYITLMQTDDNAVMMSKGAFSANVGDKLTIKATVKDHARYRDQMQTIVQRVKVVE